MEKRDEKREQAVVVFREAEDFHFPSQERTFPLPTLPHWVIPQQREECSFVLDSTEGGEATSGRENGKRGEQNTHEERRRTQEQLRAMGKKRTIS